MYSILDVDNMIYIRIDDGTKTQPILVTKSLSDAVLALDDIRNNCIGNYKLVECVIQ